MTTRRAFITGLVSFVAAPAIVRVGSLMPVKVIIEPLYGRSPNIITLAEYAKIILTEERMVRWRQTFYNDLGAAADLMFQEQA